MLENRTVSSTREALVQGTADRMVAAIDDAVGAAGWCFIALAGGSTPREVYAELARRSATGKIPWQGVHLFWGDERSVPPDHPDSNFRMVQESLLAHIEIPAENVHRMLGELAPDAAATDYERTIRDAFPQQPARFDFVLLGMGDDGHTASLFPGTTALDEREKEVTAVFVPKLETWRITLTYPVLNRAKMICLLVAGHSKADMLQHLAQLPGPTPEFPVTQLNPQHGELHWLLDSEAAHSLK